MRNILITALLLGNSLLANASEAEQVVSTQANLPPVVQIEVSDTSAMQSESDDDTAEASDKYSAVEPHILLGANTTTSKAYEDLLKVMPQLGYGTSNSKNTEASATKQQQKDELHTEVLKLSKLPHMRSSIVLIYDENGERPLHSKNADVVAPIASITKLMTAMVVLDAKLPLDEEISISALDINHEKFTRSRMRTGMTLSRGELLKLALMASENLSAAALARTYPGGTEAALVKMNAKARDLGMTSTRFLDPTGLNSGNVSTATDLVKMVRAAQGYELIHQFTTSTSHTLETAGHRTLKFHNTNPLVKNASWDIGLSKTGYISEAGRCLVMEAKITEQPVIIVLLDSWGRNSRVGDANRVKKWMEKASFSPKNM